jgi:GntR family transcriptional regulator
MTTHSATLFSIATGSSEPIYRQLVDQARRLVAGGQLAPGDASRRCARSPRRSRSIR